MALILTRDGAHAFLDGAVSLELCRMTTERIGPKRLLFFTVTSPMFIMATARDASRSEAFATAGFETRALIIWTKPHFVFDGAHYHSQYEGCFYAVRKGRNAHCQIRCDQSDVWPIVADADGRDGRTIHGTQKPVDCMLRPIENSSQPGDAVYDPFVGSGTTIIAAEIAERRCYAMDIDPLYCTVAIERWQNFTGREAILEATGQTFAEVKNERLIMGKASQGEITDEINRG
jgi:DNA modification methylase